MMTTFNMYCRWEGLTTFCQHERDWSPFRVFRISIPLTDNQELVLVVPEMPTMERIQYLSCIVHKMHVSTNGCFKQMHEQISYPFIPIMPDSINKKLKATAWFMSEEHGGRAMVSYQGQVSFSKNIVSASSDVEFEFSENLQGGESYDLTFRIDQRNKKVLGAFTKFLTLPYFEGKLLPDVFDDSDLLSFVEMQLVSDLTQTLLKTFECKLKKQKIPLQYKMIINEQKVAIDIIRIKIKQENQNTLELATRVAMNLQEQIKLSLTERLEYEKAAWLEINQMFQKDWLYKIAYAYLETHVEGPIAEPLTHLIQELAKAFKTSHEEIQGIKSLLKSPKKKAPKPRNKIEPGTAAITLAKKPSLKNSALMTFLYPFVEQLTQKALPHFGKLVGQQAMLQLDPRDETSIAIKIIEDEIKKFDLELVECLEAEIQRLQSESMDNPDKKQSLVARAALACFTFLGHDFFYNIMYLFLEQHVHRPPTEAYRMLMGTMAQTFMKECFATTEHI